MAADPRIAIQKLQGSIEATPAVLPFFPAGMTATLEFHDGDELTAAIRKWNHHLTQTGNGRFSGSLTLAHTASLQFHRAMWSPGFYIQGEPPAGSVSVGIQCGGTRPAIWHGTPIADNEVIMVENGQEIDCQTHMDCDMLVMSFQSDVFARQVDRLVGRPLSHAAVNSRLAAADHTAQEKLARRWGELLESAMHLGEQLGDRQIASHIEADAIELLLSHLSPVAKTASMAERRRAALEARRYMISHMEALPTIADICQAVHATERTLHLGFREVFGMTPKRFLKALRLNAVRNELVNVDARFGVTDIAFRWGFFHLSNFAADYFEMFQELPSETLQLHAGQ